MARIDDAITTAKGELTAAQGLSDTDEAKATKVAASQVKVSILEGQKKAIEDDINDAVTGRLPHAKEAAKNAERKSVAAALEIPADQLTDEKLAEVKRAYQGQQSEVEREKQAREAAETRATGLETSEQRARQIASTARANLEATLKRQAAEREHLKLGVVHTDEQSYLEGVMQLTGMEDITVDVDVDDDGNLTVKGEPKGAKEAAEKVKERYAAMYGDYAPNLGAVPPNPRARNNVKQGQPYTGNYSIPGART